MAGKPEWHAFRVDSATSFGSRPLNRIWHVSHLRYAKRIFEDDSIRAGLVYDKSKLNKSRTRVVWLSPNDWNYGSRYGNVRFEFDWKSLIEGCLFYWVESINYQPRAARILISADEHGDLEPYDPAKDNGPWILEDGEHLWNGSFCLEVMLERDIPLSDCTKIDFTRHHDNQCCIEPWWECRDRGVESGESTLRFCAWLAANKGGEAVPDRPDGTSATEQVALGTIEDAWGRTARRVRRLFKNVKPVGRIEMSVVLARSCLRAMYEEDEDQLKKLLRFFQSEEAAVASLERAYVRAFPHAADAIKGEG
jgi:hypothetical protein